MFKFIKNILGLFKGSSQLSFLQRLSSSTIKRGSEELLQAYNSSPWLRAVGGKVSFNVATVQWTLFATKKKGDAKFNRCRKAQICEIHKDRSTILKKLHSDGELVEIEEHPILEILNNGNAAMHGLNNSKLNQIYTDLLGQSYLVKERDELGVPIALWVVSPLWVTQLPTINRPFFTITINGVVKDILPEDVICFIDPNPVSPYERGSGLGQSLADELDTDEFSAKFVKDFFLNSARPDIIVMADGLQKGDTKRLQHEWNHSNRGISNSHKAHFLNKKLDITVIPQDLKSLKVTELRKFERDLIIQVWGVPPEIMGIVENSNRATSTVADSIYAKWVLMPRLELQRSTYQKSLIPDFDDRLILHFESPIPEDKQHQLEVMKNAPWAFSIDEHRKASGQSPKEDGKGGVHLVPMNLMPVENLNIDLDKISKLNLNKINQMQLEDLLDEVDVKILFNAVKSDIIDMINSFGNEAFSGFLTTPAVNEFVNTQSFNRLNNTVNATTRDSLRMVLQDSIDNDQTIVTLTSNISEVFDNAVGNRARTIARTESVRASNFGAVEGMKQAGIKGKSWLSSRDAVVRDSHSPGVGLDGQKVAVNGNFKSPITGASGPFPGSMGRPDEDINCRCTILPEIDLKGMTEEAKDAFWKNFESQRRPFERSYIRNLRKGFKAQRKAVLDKLNEFT